MAKVAEHTNGRVAPSIYEPKGAPTPQVPAEPASESPTEEARVQERPSALSLSTDAQREVLEDADQIIVLKGHVASGKSALLSCAQTYVSTERRPGVRVDFVSPLQEAQMSRLAGHDVERTVATVDMAQVLQGAQAHHEVLGLLLDGKRVGVIAVHAEATKTRGAYDAPALARVLSTRGVATILCVNPYAASVGLARGGIPTITARLQKEWGVSARKAFRAATCMTLGLAPDVVDLLMAKRLDDTLAKVRLSLDPAGFLEVQGDQGAFERDVDELVRAASTRRASVIATLESAASQIQHKAVIVTRRDVLELAGQTHDVGPIFDRFDGGNAHVRARTTAAGVLSTVDVNGRLVTDGPGAEQDGAAILDVIRYLSATTPCRRSRRWFNPLSWWA